MLDVTTIPKRLAIAHRGTSTSRSTVHLARNGVGFLPYSDDQLAARLATFAGCWICGGPKQSRDHVKPLAAGGIDALCNIRPICRSCNSSKAFRWGAKLTAWLPKRRALCGVLGAVTLFR